MKKKRRKFLEKNVGKVRTVLFEEQNIEGKMKGYTSNYIRVLTEYNSSIINKFSNVKLEEIKGEIVTGKLEEKKFYTSKLLESA